MDISLSLFKKASDKRRYFVYLLLAKGKVVYVGRSCSMRNRVATHRRDKAFDELRLREMPDFYSSCRFEAQCIAHWKPHYNTYKAQANARIAAAHELRLKSTNTIPPAIKLNCDPRPLSARVAQALADPTPSPWLFPVPTQELKPAQSFPIDLTVYSD